MGVKHNGEPRNAGYSAEIADLYQDKETGWLGRKSPNIFKGKKQKDLFLFAMAIGKRKGMKSEFKPGEKKDNVSVDALKEAQKWALLSVAIEESNDLLCLKDEGPLYGLAEEYAREGILILQSRMEHAGINYPKELELELREILGALPK